MNQEKGYKPKTLALEQSFGFKRPELMKYWHPTLNEEKTPYDVAENSDHEAWWLMECGHFFKARVKAFVSTQFCRVCSNSVFMKGQNDLKTTHPHLMKLWDYELNDIKPEDITASYSKKVWWLCHDNEKHKYERPVNVQAGMEKNTCSLCSSKIIKEGMNSLKDTHPEVAKHYDNERNKKTSGQVTWGSPGSFKWICDCGNQFSRKMSRAIKTQLCGECLQKQRKEVSYNERFKRVAMDKFELTKPYSAYSEEIEVKHLVCGKSFKVEPETFIRTPKCNHCEKAKVLKKGENDLESQKPLLAKYFNIEKNGVLPSEVFASGRIEYWWKWECGHELKENTNSMKNIDECPVCKQNDHQKKIESNWAKVDLSNLPCKKMKKGRAHSVLWDECIGLTIRAFYEGIWYDILIKDVVRKNKAIMVTIYNEEFGEEEVQTATLKNHGLNGYFKRDKSEFLYEIGSDVIGENGKMKIASRYRTNLNKKYICKCNVCGHEVDKFEEEIEDGVGCGVCSGAIFKQGVNDIATKAPWMIPWLKNKEDAHKYAKSANQKTEFKCIHCGHEKKVLIGNFSKRGMSCICGDGVSIPEKFVYSILTQLNRDFEHQYSPEWVGNKFYDFYDKDLNFIIETHGGQHYVETYRAKKDKKTGGKVRTLEEEQENDRIKRELAKTNGVKLYLELDCRHSDFSFIRNSVENSILSEVYDLSKINWEDVYNSCLSSRMMECIDLYNQGLFVSDIAEKTGYDRTGIIKYLKKGTAAGKCLYDSKSGHIKAMEDLKQSYLKPLKCIDTGEAFQNSRFAAEKLTQRYGKEFKISGISSVLNGSLETYRGLKFEKMSEDEWLNYIPIKEEDIDLNHLLKRSRKVEKYVDLSNVLKESDSGRIEWKETIGKQVPFKCGAIEGVFTIIDYRSDGKKSYVKIKADKYDAKWIYTRSLREAKITKYFKNQEQLLIK